MEAKKKEYIEDSDRDCAERIKMETRWQKILDNMIAGCMVIGFDWTFLYVNDAAAIQGFQQRVNLIGKTVRELHPGIENTQIFLMYKRCMEERIHLEFEEKYVFQNEITRWFDFQVEPIDEGIFVISMDVTEKKQAEEKINKDQELLRQSQRLAHFGSWELDLLHNVLFWSDETYQIFEIEPKIFCATYQAFLDLVHPEDKDYIKASYSDAVTNKAPYNIIYRLKFSGGRIKYLHEQAETFYNEYGTPVRSTGTVHDITSQKQAEILLQKNEYKYQQVIENISDGLMIDDVSGKVVFCNKRFLELFDFKEEDLPNITLEDFIVPEYRQMIRERHNRRVAGEKVADFFEFEGLRKNGSKRWCDVRVTNVIENNEIIGTQSIVRDITERKEAEQLLELQNRELKKINSELDRFVYSTSHDLRAPLMSLLGLIDLCEQSADALELNQYFEMMKKSINRLDDTIKEIISYSKNSRTELHFEQLDIKNIVNNLVETLKHISGVNDIEILSIFEDEIPFFSDKLRVTTIINNLIINASKYQRMEEDHPVIKFTFISTPEEAVIMVEDNGEGIAKDKFDKIFEMFYRNSEKSVGSGLGLYICKEIVSKMGGFINVRSELGVGSAFTVRLPNQNLNNNKSFVSQ